MSKPGDIIEAYFDGACAPENPAGYMGIGVYIKDGDSRIGLSEGFERNYRNSNNLAEYKAVNLLLRELAFKKNRIIIIRGDSKLVVNQLNGVWELRGGKYIEEARLARELYKDLRKINVVSIKWIPREQNTIADDYSKQGIEKAQELEQELEPNNN